MTRKRRQRIARKLILPLIALAMMTTMMFIESRGSGEAPVSPALQQR